ncbi:MAG: chloride channel protein [Peptococcaceae bacterium]|nr:chloride channel protein [Peptococcaceae bacterium]
MKEKRDYLLLGVFSLLMGALSGVVIWAVFHLMHWSITLIWETIPMQLGASHSLAYNVIVCVSGGVLIGLMQKKFGALPEPLPAVMARVKKEGGYPYNRLPILIVMFLLPIIFGGAIGPEAGLTGVIAGLWTFVCTTINYTGVRLEAMAETGIAATLGIIFGAPLFGIATYVEPDDEHEHYREKLLSKKTRIYLYGLGVVGIFAAMFGLNRLLGSGTGLPRFSKIHAIGWDQWKWSLLLIAAGIVMALVYMQCTKIAMKLAAHLADHIVLSCIVAGLFVGIVGHVMPAVMFSGQDALDTLLVTWYGYSAVVLLLIAFAKAVLTSVCISFGWRGGNIFPVVYMGAAVGYAFAIVVDMQNSYALLDGSFAVALVVASMTGFILRKPVTAVAILLLCFPITYLPALTVASVIAAKLGTLYAKRQQKVG